jgi:hypothetical protein
MVQGVYENDYILSMERESDPQDVVRERLDG